MSETSGFSWTAVSVASGLAARQVSRTLVTGRDIAYWRGEDGRVRAWHNRCPHRGMRLSFGFVRGDRLTCVYHGWTYNGEGACAAIPAHPRMAPPRTIAANRYKVSESGGLVWVASQEEESAPPVLDGTWSGLRSMAIDRPAKHVLSALTEVSLAELKTESISIVAPSVYHCRLSQKRDVLCAVQDVADGLSFLHVALDAEADIETRRNLNRWSTCVRRTAERRQLGH